MTPTADIPLKEPVISAAASDAEQLERARIDASTRVPVLMFYASAMVWLLIGTLLAGFVSFKLHSPDWLSDVSFLTWGRLRPVHMNVMVYGWASMAAMGTAIWLMARLCRTTLRHPLLIVAGIWFWNIGVLIGVIGILMGYSTGYDWLEFPPYAAVVLFVAYALIMSWAVLLMELLKATQLARPRMISVKLLEKRMSQVGLMAPLPADLPPRPVDRALPNFARQLKWVSVSRLPAARRMARAWRPLPRRVPQKIPGR